MAAEQLEKLLIDYRDLKSLGIKATREHITRLVRQGRFPRPIRLFGDDQSTRSYWRYADIVAWIEARAAATAELPTQRRSLHKARPSNAATVGSSAESRANTAHAGKARSRGQRRDSTAPENTAP